jgi:hypothetical protein
MVAFIGGTLLVIGYLLTKQILLKKILNKETLREVIPFTIPLITYTLTTSMYNFINNEKNYALNLGFYKQPLTTYISNYDYYITYFLKFISIPFSLFFITSILLIIYLVKFKSIDRTKIFLIGSLISASAYITFFHEAKPETEQTLNNTLSPIMMSLTLFIIIGFRKSKEVLYILPILIILGCFNLFSNTSKTGYSQEYTTNPYEKILKDVNPTFNWGYLSDRYWSNWTYNNEICQHPILRIKNTRFPIDIAPLFDSEDDKSKYCFKNEASPVCEFNANTKKIDNVALANFFKKYQLEYLYIDPNAEISDELVSFLEENAVSKGYDLWKIKEY